MKLIKSFVATVLAAFLLVGCAGTPNPARVATGIQVMSSVATYAALKEKPHTRPGFERAVKGLDVAIAAQTTDPAAIQEALKDAGPDVAFILMNVVQLYQAYFAEWQGSPNIQEWAKQSATAIRNGINSALIATAPPTE